MLVRHRHVPHSVVLGGPLEHLFRLVVSVSVRVRVRVRVMVSVRNRVLVSVR